MKAINAYNFHDNRRISVFHIGPEDREGTSIPDCDNLYLQWRDEQREDNNSGLYMRPDEALMIAKQLIDAVWKITAGYEEQLLEDGYYGYSETLKGTCNENI